MANPRNLNYPLGSIGQTLERLSEVWRERILPIQCIVINKANELPGEGIGWFLVKEEDFRNLSPGRKREIVKAELWHAFAYPKWRQVLETVGLPPPKTNYSNANERASGFRAGGETEQHRRLKEFVARTPLTVGLPPGTPQGKLEVMLPSGDCLDVSFRATPEWVAAEIKSKISPEADILRGLYQCVKYQAVMRAVEASEN